MSRPHTLPKNEIRVCHGEVSEVKEWAQTNGEGHLALWIYRCAGGFRYFASDPTHGGWSSEPGTLDQVLSGLHAEISDKYKRLFALTQFTDAEFENAGFKGYELTVG